MSDLISEQRHLIALHPLDSNPKPWERTSNVSLCLSNPPEAAGAARQVNENAFLEMRRPGQERLVPKDILAVGHGLQHIVPGTQTVAPSYATGTGADKLWDMSMKRIQKFGIKGVVALDSHRVNRLVNSSRADAQNVGLETYRRELAVHVAAAEKLAPAPQQAAPAAGTRPVVVSTSSPVRQAPPTTGVALARRLPAIKR